MSDSPSVHASKLKYINETVEKTRATVNRWVSELRDNTHQVIREDDAKPHPLLRAALANLLNTFGHQCAIHAQAQKVSINFDIAHHSGVLPGATKNDYSSIEELTLLFNYDVLPPIPAPFAHLKAVLASPEIMEHARTQEPIQLMDDHGLIEAYRAKMRPVPEEAFDKPQLAIRNVYETAAVMTKYYMDPKPEFQQYVYTNDDTLTIMFYMLPVETIPVLLMLELHFDVMRVQIAEVEKATRPN